MLRLFLFFTSGTYTHIRTSSIHTLVLVARRGGGGGGGWTLKHEMNMSSVNFDWHFSHRARIYGALYIYIYIYVSEKRIARRGAGKTRSDSPRTHPNTNLHITEVTRLYFGIRSSESSLRWGKYEHGHVQIRNFAPRLLNKPKGLFRHLPHLCVGCITYHL